MIHLHAILEQPHGQQHPLGSSDESRRQHHTTTGHNRPPHNNPYHLTPNTMVQICLTAEGVPPISYQWQRDLGSGWENITGAGSTCYTVESVQLSNDGDQYRCFLVNDCGSAYSDVATLNVNPRIKPDFDCDNDVDQEDFGRFQRCLSGSGIPQTETDCQTAKLDSDDDVDFEDFDIFIGCMNGEGNPPGC